MRLRATLQTRKTKLETELRDAVAAARAREDALANAVSVGAVCDHYEAWQREQGKTGIAISTG